MIKKTKFTFLVLMVVGFLCIVTSSVLSILLDKQMFSGLLAGMGVGIIIPSFIQLYRLQKNPVYAKEQEICSQDERNVLIRSKAATVSFTITLFTLLCGILYFAYQTNKPVLAIFYVIFFAHVLSYLLSVFFFRKKL